MPAPFRMRMALDSHSTAIAVWRGKDPRPVIFTGDAYWQWGLGQTYVPAEQLHLRNRGQSRCWAEQLHNTLEGWHACVLHTGEELFVLPQHPDYPRVEALWHEAQAV